MRTKDFTVNTRLELDTGLNIYVREHGACRDTDVNLFFPIGEGGGRRAKDGTRKSRTAEEMARAVIAEYCDNCVAREACLEMALHYNVDAGHASESVYGGTVRAERVAIRRAREGVAA